ncbi:MAG: squalene synthase HpnC [Giesbergeria sp.]
MPGEAGHTAPLPITHYENFPVASWLCPPTLRAPIAAIYAFARTADDIADEGDAAPSERLDALAAYAADLQAVAAGAAASIRWPEVFAPLATVLQSHALPVPLLSDLLSAFAQDVRQTAAAAGYANRAELLDYCRRSANPVGRLLLHLYRVDDTEALAQSDAICSALQLINFWQDLSVDLPRGRFYVPEADAAVHGLGAHSLQHAVTNPATDALVDSLAAWARASMLAGAPLVHRLPGRAGWELRLVVQGGLRVLDKVQALRGRCLVQRPRIRVWDTPLLLARALAM